MYHFGILFGQCKHVPLQHISIHRNVVRVDHTDTVSRPGLLWFVVTGVFGSSLILSKGPSLGLQQTMKLQQDLIKVLHNGSVIVCQARFCNADTKDAGWVLDVRRPSTLQQGLTIFGRSKRKSSVDRDVIGTDFSRFQDRVDRIQSCAAWLVRLRQDKVQETPAPGLDQCGTVSRLYQRGY